MEAVAAAQSTLQAASSTEVLLSHYSIERIWGNIGEIFCNKLKGFNFFSRFEFHSYSSSLIHGKNNSCTYQI